MSMARTVLLSKRVLKSFWIFHLTAFGKRQPNSILERIPYADYSIVGPDRDSHRVAWFLPLYFFDQAGVGFLGQSAQE